MIDLHTHSNCSDGVLSPEELVRKAHADGISHLALTDHDTVDGIDEAAAEAGKLSITFYAGLEISAAFGDGEVHILGIGIDHKKPEIAAFVKKLQKNRQKRNIAILENLIGDGLLSGNAEQLLERHAVTGRPHVAALLIENGSAADFQEAFDKYLGFRKPYYIKRMLPEAAEVFTLVRSCGGISSVAHPNTLFMDKHLSASGLTGCLKAWKEEGLDGVEAFHPNLSLSLSRSLRKTAVDLYLLTTGGSDYHGHDRTRMQKLGRWHGKKRIPVGIINRISGRITTC